MINFTVKYRPQTFDTFIGNAKTIEDLKKRSIKNEIPQVIYITGETGSGKTTLIYLIAKSILCQNKKADGNPCNVCDTCKSINEDKDSLYFLYFNCTNIDIDQSRKIEDIAVLNSFSPVKQLIIVLDEVQELFGSNKARRNLLTVLEMNLKDVYFILASMNDGKVENALKNRGVKYVLQNITISDIAHCLKNICDDRKIVLDEEKIKAILYISEYCEKDFRMAISMLERIIYSNLWAIEEIEKEFNIVSKDKIKDIVNKILNKDFSIFSIEINKNVLDNIIKVLLLYYKAINNIELQPWQRKDIVGLVKGVDSIYVSNILSKLFELNKYVYNTNMQMEYYLLNAMMCKDKKDNLPILNEQKRKKQ